MATGDFHVYIVRSKKECIDFAYEPLCDEDYAEEFKQAIIDKFSTDVEVEQ